MGRDIVGSPARRYIRGDPLVPSQQPEAGIVTQPPVGPAPQRRLPRHLMDPNNPRPPQPARGAMSLTTVQMWIMSTLAVSTIMHLSLGLVAAALYVPASRLDARIGLNILAGFTGMVAVAAGLGIHSKRMLSWWLLLGVLPLPIGLYFTFWF